MSPVELLKHTEMAISPTIYQQHLKLIELDKQARGHLLPCRTWAYHDIQATTPLTFAPLVMLASHVVITSCWPSNSGS